MGVINQSDMSLEVLATQLDNAGWNLKSDTEMLTLHTENGIGFTIDLDEEKCFVLFRTCLPVRNDFLASIDYCNDLNFSKFMGKFAIDADNDLRVSYAMPYEKSLLIAQFSRIALRFASLLEHVVSQDKDNLIFDFDKPHQQKIDFPTPTTVLQ